LINQQNAPLPFLIQRQLRPNGIQGTKLIAQQQRGWGLLKRVHRLPPFERIPTEPYVVGL
jgi:hypothetical protein